MWRFALFPIFVVLWSIDQLVRPRRRILRTASEGAPVTGLVVRGP